MIVSSSSIMSNRGVPLSPWVRLILSRNDVGIVDLVHWEVRGQLSLILYLSRAKKSVRVNSLESAYRGWVDIPSDTLHSSVYL